MNHLGTCIFYNLFLGFLVVSIDAFGLTKVVHRTASALHAVVPQDGKSPLI
jgi:hypothetical protein